VFLVVIDLLSVSHDLGGGGNQGHELGELRTKFIDAGIVNPEKPVGFELLGKTGPVKNEIG